MNLSETLTDLIEWVGIDLKFRENSTIAIFTVLQIFQEFKNNFKYPKMCDEKRRNYDSTSGIDHFFCLNHPIGEKSPLNYGLIGKSDILPSLERPPPKAQISTFSVYPI